MTLLRLELRQDRVKAPDPYTEMQKLLDGQIKRKRKIPDHLREQLLAFSQAFADAARKVITLAFGSIPDGKITIRMTDAGNLESITVPFTKNNDNSIVILKITCSKPEDYSKEAIALALRDSGLGIPSWEW